jgi:hypothetical protein
MSRLRNVLPLLVVALFGAACTGADDGGRITYTDPENRALFSIPSDWNLYELEELAGLSEVPFVNAVDSILLPAISTVVFDAAPVKDVSKLSDDLAGATFPVGALTIRSIGTDERDFVSRNLLTQSVLPYRTMGNSQEITKEDFSFGNGFDGVRLLVAYQQQGTEEVGVAYLISVTDADDRQMYSIVAGCSQDCFVANQATIEELVDSWLVNTRG